MAASARPKRPDRAICPLCLVDHAISQLGRRCADCDSEAAEIELVSRAELLRRVPLEQWLDFRERWARETRFLPDYHAARLRRLDALVAMKRASGREPAPPRRRSSRA